MMFGKKKEHHVQSIILAGIMVSLVVVIALIILINRIEPSPNNGTDPSLNPFDVNDDSQLSGDTVATIGQNYIKELASYNEVVNNPVRLIENEFIEEGLWVARYEVEQVDDLSIQIYSYFLEILDGRVMNHNLSVLDESKTLLVSAPEPEEIISSQQLLVKGQIFPTEGDEVPKEVMISLFDGQGGLIQSLPAEVEKDNHNSFLKTIDVSQSLIGEVNLTVETENITVSVPFIISKKTE